MTVTSGRPWCPGNERVGNKSVTYHPPWRVSVNPSLGDWSTETRIPTIPSPWGVTTCPRITDTRLHSVRRSVVGAAFVLCCWLVGWRVCLVEEENAMEEVRSMEKRRKRVQLVR